MPKLIIIFYVALLHLNAMANEGGAQETYMKARALVERHLKRENLEILIYICKSVRMQLPEKQ